MTDAEKAMEILPVLEKEWINMNSGTMQQYQENLEKTADKAITMISQLIDDGTMSMDVQTAVSAAAVLTKAQKDLMDSKRKLIEVTMKGALMMKALADEPKRESVLDQYAQRFALENNGNVEDDSIHSIFGMIDKEHENDESELESSTDDNGVKAD